MTSRVLIADDSLTIQKVIGITLANSGYELVECLNESDLFGKIQSSQFDLILLDFNLSDSGTGYDLAKQIHKTLPNAAIIVMLGTFDTVDDSQFEACGITDKIVKPFESTKFIKKCRDVLEGTRSVPSASKEQSQVEAESSKADNLDSWKVDAPKMHSHGFENDKIEEDSFKSSEAKESALNPLSSEIEGWGFTPDNSIEEKFQKVFPPVIEEASEVNIIERLQSSSKFIQNAEIEQNNDETKPSFELPEDLNRNILNEIDNELTAESFWAVDEVVPRKSEEEEYILETNLVEITTDLTETVQAFKEIDLKPESSQKIKAEVPSSASIDQDAIVEKLKIAMRPMIDEMVKEYCRQSAEKIAWEVIPDLAENLIRKEIKEISDSILR